MRVTLIAASAIACVVCLAGIPFTAPTFAEAFGVVGALVSSVVLAVCALVMAWQVVTLANDVD